jgi:hypothetical protein
MHLELFQIKLGWVRLEYVDKAVDHIRPDCQNLDIWAKQLRGKTRQVS